PPTGVSTSRQPALPIAGGIAEQRFGLIEIRTTPRVVVRTGTAQYKRGLLPLLEHEVGDRTVGILLERHRSGQTKTQPRSIEAGHAPRNVGFVTSPGIIKGGAALQAKRDLAPDHTHSSDQFVRHSASACDRHIIFYLSHAIIVHETAYKDVGVGPIELLVTKSLARLGDL